MKGSFHQGLVIGKAVLVLVLVLVLVVLVLVLLLVVVVVLSLGLLLWVQTSHQNLLIGLVPLKEPNDVQALPLDCPHLLCSIP